MLWALLAAAGDTTIPIGQIANVGLVGVILLMAIFRFGLVPAWTLNEMKEQRDAAVVAGIADKTRLIAERDAERVARNELETVVRDKLAAALEANRITQEAVMRFITAAAGKGNA